jgi:antitoxin MazE
MRAHIVKIGNSRGIRIPKALLEQTGLHGEVEMSVQDGTLVIAPGGRARQGWDDAFRRMAVQGDDALLDGDLAAAPSSFDEESWQWE